MLLLSSTILKKVDTVRDLGVKLDYKMTMVEHIDTILNKAYNQLGFENRVCNT